MYATRLNNVGIMTRSRVWHDSFVSSRSGRSCRTMTWLIHMCDMAHSYVYHDSFMCVTRLIHMCDMTHSYVWHDSFICVTWLIHVCGMTPVMTRWCVWHDSFMWHGSFVCENMTHLYVPWLIHVTRLMTWLIRDMTHSRHDSFMRLTWLMTWLLHAHTQGVRAEEAVALFKKFYQRENIRAPVPNPSGIV